VGHFGGKNTGGGTPRLMAGPPQKKKSLLFCRPPRISKKRVKNKRENTGGTIGRWGAGKGGGKKKNKKRPLTQVGPPRGGGGGCHPQKKPAPNPIWESFFGPGNPTPTPRGPHGHAPPKGFSGPFGGGQAFCLAPNQGSLVGGGGRAGFSWGGGGGFHSIFVPRGGRGGHPGPKLGPCLSIFFPHPRGFWARPPFIGWGGGKWAPPARGTNN